MKKRLYLLLFTLVGSFTLLFTPMSKAVLHAEESVEETTSQEESLQENEEESSIVEESTPTSDFEPVAYILDDEEGGFYYEFTLNSESEIYIYISDYNGNEMKITTDYVKADKIIYIPEVDLGFVIEENNVIRLIPSYTPQEEEETTDDYVEDSTAIEEAKDFFETMWGKIASYIMAISGGTLLSASLTWVYNLAQRKIKEKDNETLKTMLSSVKDLLNVISNVVASTSEDKETLSKLLTDTGKFLIEIKETLNNQKSDIEKINALNVKFNALLSVASKTVSVNPEYLNVAEDINKIIDKELGK